MEVQDGQIVQGAEAQGQIAEGGAIAPQPTAGDAANATTERTDAQAVAEILGVKPKPEPAPWHEQTGGKAKAEPRAETDEVEPEGEGEGEGEPDDDPEGDPSGERVEPESTKGDKAETKPAYATEQGARALPAAHIAPALSALRLNGYDDAELEAMSPGDMARRACAIARDALGRSGMYDKAELDAMKLETLLGKGLKLARVQAQNDANYAELARLRRATGTSTTTNTRLGAGDTTARGINTAAGRSGRANPSVSDRPGTDPQLVDRYNRLIDESVLDDRAAEELRAVLNELVKTGSAQPQRASGHGAASSSEDLAQQATMLFKETAESLSEQFPALKTNSGLQAMLNRMNRLDPQGHLVGDPAAFLNRFRFACELQFGRDSVRSAQTELLARSKTNADGQPSKPRGSTQTLPMTQERYDKLAARAAMESNGDMKLFERMMATVPKPATPS